MKFRAIFECYPRADEMKAVDQYIRGESTDSPLFLETHTQEALVALEEGYRKKTQDTIDNSANRQAWVYAASVERDAQYARFRRTRIKAQSLNSLYMENYGGSKIAADSHYLKKQ